MDVRQKTVGALLVLAALVFGGIRTWRAARVAMLPRLDASALDGSAVDEQRATWLEFDEVLQCEVLDPCLDSLGGDGWSHPARIADACGDAKSRLEALSTPPDLAPGLRRNVDLLREYWLGEVTDLARAAEQLAAGRRGGVSPFAWKLDTCTSDSIPARVDQLLGVVGVGEVSAKCKQIHALRHQRGH